MKKLIFTVVLFTTIGMTYSFGQVNNESKNSNITTVQNSTFGVRGNCGMCKKTIEKAASSVEGVSEVNWDKDRKSISVSFDKEKTDELKIHNAIAKSGYDTEKVQGNLNAYQNLHSCCKYDRSMKMNQKVKSE